MLEDKTCELLCKKTLKKEEKDLKQRGWEADGPNCLLCCVVCQDRFRNMIADEYLVNWIVDNLPATTRYRQTGVLLSRTQE